jgi:hypothetical protein
VTDRLGLYVWLAGFGVLALAQVFQVMQYVFR